MPRDVVIRLMNGKQGQGVLFQPITPKSNKVRVQKPGSDKVLSHPLSQVCDVKFMGTSHFRPFFSENNTYQWVQTIHGQKFAARVNEATAFSAGIFIHPIDGNSSFSSVFVTHWGLQSRSDLTLGEAKQIFKTGFESQQQLKEVPNREPEKKRQGREYPPLAKSIDLVEDNIAEETQKSHENRMGELLLEAGVINAGQLQSALQYQQEHRSERLGKILIHRKLIGEKELLKTLAVKFGLPFVDLSEINPSPEVINSLPADEVIRLRVFPISVGIRHVVVASSDPTNFSIPDNLRFLILKEIKIAVATSDQIDTAIQRHYMTTSGTMDTILGEVAGEIDSSDISQIENRIESVVNEHDSGLIKLVNHILVDSYLKGASDVHVEPGLGTKNTRIRYRIDGDCIDVSDLPYTYCKAFISRLKIISHLDIGERRRPQSGKIVLGYKNRKIEYRVEVTPTIGGNEDVVCRVLTSAKPMPLNELAFTTQNLETFTEIISKPHGIVLVVGPTGSGKTTTLHSALRHINTPRLKIWTAEDPVEITQEGLRQVQVSEKIGFGFREALRSFLRADPDVIMIGEMRDIDTAKIAIEASLTGHLVFSTLHTNSVYEAAARLLEMGVDPFNLSDAILGILAQRLLKCLCPHCREDYDPAVNEVRDLIQQYEIKWFKKHALNASLKSLRLSRAKGCDLCNYAGYKGRMGIHELMRSNNAIKQSIKNKMAAAEIREIALSSGMRTLKMDGIGKVLSKKTDMTQVQMVCN